MRGSGFLLAYLLVFSVLLAVAIIWTRVDIHIFLNKCHFPCLDELMKYWTWLGDGIVLVILIVPTLLISFRHFFILLSSFSIAGIDSQILKRLFFGEMARPLKYFEINNIDYQLYLVPEVRQLSWHSFPSGHTAAAFSVFFAVALMSKSRIIQLLCFILATGVAYSRIYLSQHFLMDVIAGSALGVAAGWISWYWLDMYDKKWLDKPVIQWKR